MPAREEVYTDLEMKQGARMRYLPAPIEDDEPVRLIDLGPAVATALDLRQLPPLP